MPSPLSTVPIAKRKQLAATLGLFSVLFVAVGAVAATGPATVAIRIFTTIALVVAVIVALMAWGVLRSVRLDSAEVELDRAIEAAVAASPGGRAQLCDCGHEHDPDEMHVVDSPAPGAHAGCGADGQGHDCAHTCDTCVLAALRPSPTRPRAERLAR